MLRDDTYHLGHEVSKTLLVAFVVLLMFLMTASVAAAEDQRSHIRPGNLPDDIDQWATPLLVDEQIESESITDEFTVTIRAWQAIQLRRAGALDEAAQLWNQLRLPAENESWRKAALSEIEFTRGNFTEAATWARESIAISPNNAVAYYILGRVELAKAAGAYPAVPVEPANVRFVKYSQDQQPIPRDVHELNAILYFEKAALLSNSFFSEAPLMGRTVVPPHPGDMAMPVVSPTIDDWLASTDIADWQTNLHVLLYRLNAQRGFWDRAESNLDRAVALGHFGFFDYARLANAKLSQGAELEAQRLLDKGTRSVVRLATGSYAEQWYGLAVR